MNWRILVQKRDIIVRHQDIDVLQVSFWTIIIVIHNCGNHAPEINTEYQFILPENTFVKMLQDYFHEKIFRKNPHGQEKGVAWRHFCEINFYDKANKHEIHKIFHHKITGIR